MALVLGLFAAPVHAQVVFVDQDATGGANDGSSWTDAYVDLQDALTAATAGDEIWVAEGVYRPSESDPPGDPDPRSVTFKLVTDVEIYGGFDGTEATRSERDSNPETNNTILSGDIGVPGDSTDNAYHVVDGSDTGTTPVLDGFTITAGVADGSSVDVSGGGMINFRSDLTLRNLIFDGNSASISGGGLIVYDCAPELTNVTFVNNVAKKGGGMRSTNGAEATLVNVTFTGNKASGQGGGLNNSDSTPSLTNVVFSDNEAVAGGGLADASSNATLTNVTFTGNEATTGGAIAHTDTAYDLFLTNAILWGNTAETSGTDQLFGASSVIIGHSIVEGSGGSGSGWNTAIGTDDGGNLDVDPQFADAAGGDFRLTGPGASSGPSPAIDAGKNDAVPAGITDDLAGEVRFVDVPDVPDTGTGTAPLVDIGAFESTGAALPVELTAFDARIDGEDVVLSWQTASEANNAGFEVQVRKQETATWAAVAFVEGAGTTPEPQSYSRRVTNLDYGTHVFRLKQVDLDGTAAYSEEVEARVALAGQYVLAGPYPNPFRRAATLMLTVPETQKVRVTLYDVLGRHTRTLHDGTLSAHKAHRIAVDADGVSSGVYLVRVVGRTFAETRRLVLVR